MFIPAAYAQTAETAAASGGSMLMAYLPIILVFIIFYFLIIRPQAKRFKEHTAMLAALKRGDMVLTNGGLVGKVTHVADTTVTLEIASGVEVKVSKPAVSQLVDESAETRIPAKKK